MAQLALVFSFPPSGDAYSLSLDMEEAQGVWSLIARGEYKKGVSKATRIRHPAICYVHKFLAHTLFARRETGAIKEEEMALLIEGLKPHLQTTATNDRIIGQPKRINFAHYLARRLLNYQDSVTSNKDHTPLLNIGGLITPILHACHAEIRQASDPTPLTFIDAPYLASTKFLVGRTKKSYGYRFELGGEKKTIMIPNTPATIFNERRNILFTPKLFYLYNPSRDGPLTTAPRKRRATPQVEEDQQEEEQELPEEIFGSHRYDFEPYSEPITNEALRKAHEHIGLLQRFVKWQNKHIKKLTKTVKNQGKMLKKLLSPSTSPRRRTEHEDMEMALALSMGQGEDAGTSTGRHGDKGKAPLSPSSSGSGNPCY